ncbi:type II secretion system minor pseudopilin GspJ [Parvularcula sp. IMCC14364]|uniref:type II secretion system minor pseudopilin GspJ n=1 Tax=Parvularcula sp. IMCC14364 TaxID=3067902 RepID=UPI0027419301|nr:type II secretion system minor pseudopilin GspJ [Parvularcula sp. IMCC14364]
MNKRHAQKGLTLVEMLVALSVFSVIATSCLVIMRLGLDSDGQLTRATQTAAEFQVARSLIKADMAQLSGRLTRNDLGQRTPAAMRGGNFQFGDPLINDEGEVLLVALVSNGRFNPNHIYPQSSLQYIEYLLVEDKIIRRVWPFLDRLDETPFTEQVLFNSVTDVSISFLDGPRWRDQWQSRVGAIAPRAVELNFEHPVFGPVRQLFFIRGASA